MDVGERRQARTARRVSGKIEERILALRSDRLGMLKNQQDAGVGTTVVQRVLSV